MCVFSLHGGGGKGEPPLSPSLPSTLSSERAGGVMRKGEGRLGERRPAPGLPARRPPALRPLPHRLFARPRPAEA